MRVPRTFIFVDLAGFTNFTAENGDDAAGRLLANFRSIVREVMSARGVRIAKWLGDGCMIVAVDSRDAVAAALELEARSRDTFHPLTLKVGIATGYALLFEGDDYIGSAVNLAARLCDAAAGWEVLMPASQLDTVPPGIVSRPHGLLSLRGFPDPIEVVELSGVADDLPRQDTSEIWTRSPFVA
jgi:class 3 adenylate cyclase